MYDYKKQLFAEEPAAEETQAEQTEEQAAEERKYTEKEMNDRIDKVVAEKFKRWKADEEKKVSEAKRLAEMNAQERAEAERDALQKELDDLRAERTVTEMKSTARSMLSDEDVPAPDAILNMLVTSDAEATKDAVEAFAKSFKAEVQKAVKAQLSGGAPKTGNKSTAKITKAEIMAVKDRRERQRLIAENPELFKKGT